jgi:anti-sigma-K factor RskA
MPSPKPAQYVAVLQRDAASPAFLLTFDLDRRTLTVRTVGAERQAGKSYELWLVSDRFASPRSLGLIGKEEFTQRPQLANYDAVTINRATYAVSVEPEGGSPTGAPTGPVLYSGKLLQATPPSFASPSP